MSEVIEKETTELVTLPPQESALELYSTAGGLDPLIQQIREKVAGTVYDMGTAKGRDECRSDAAKIGRSKTAIEKLGKALSAEYKEIPKKIDAERRRAFDTLEVLQKQVRQPLTEWEEAEEARLELLNAAVMRLNQFSANASPQLEAEALRGMLTEATATIVDGAWDEFETEAHRAKEKAISALSEALATREKYDAEQAELAKLRAEAEARRIQDEKDRIAREAAEAATRAAEEKARIERDAITKREADAKAAAERAEQDKQEAIKRQQQAEARAESEKLAAEQRAKDAAERARRAEVQRQADEKAQQEADAKRREADRNHKQSILRAAKEAIIEGGLSEDQAVKVVKLIAAGKVPNVTISY